MGDTIYSYTGIRLWSPLGEPWPDNPDDLTEEECYEILDLLDREYTRAK